MIEKIALLDATGDIVKRIKELMKENETVYVAFDGMSASGKSTVAYEVASKLGASLIHMDDFFLQDHQRSASRFEEIGGNVDYERFIKEVVNPLKKKKTFSYQTYNCQTKSFGEDVHVDKQLVLVEGAYSMRSEWAFLFDLKVLFLVDEEEQKKRIIKRNQPFLVKRFFEEWIPYEHKYIKANKLKEVVDLIVL